MTSEGDQKERVRAAIAAGEAGLAGLENRRATLERSLEPLRQELLPTESATTRCHPPKFPLVSGPLDAAAKVGLQKERLRSIPPDEQRLLLATACYVGDGFDDARLDTPFFAMPISWRGTLVQYAGRLHRDLPGKTEARIVDYVDRQVPALARMFERRMRGYREIGYRVPAEPGP
jgi:hypothetical protein